MFSSNNRNTDLALLHTSHTRLHTSPYLHMLFFKQDRSISVNEDLNVHPNIYCRCQQSCVLPCGLSGCFEPDAVMTAGSFSEASAAVSNLDICGCTVYVCSV